MTRHIVAKAKRHESDTVPGDFGELKVPCPKCGGEIKENYKKFQCQKCDFAMWKIVAGRQLEIPEVDELISKGVVGPLQGFRSKMGRPFAAIIKMGPEFKPEFDFGQGQTNADGTSPRWISRGWNPIGKCPNPKCGGRVFENAMSYFCENAVAASPTCAFRTGKIVLQREMERAQVMKLIGTGKTDLLPKFISKKGRPFSAYLKVGDGGKVGFEFAPREPRKKGDGTKSSQPKAPVETIDFTGEPVLGKCPKCGGKVYDTAAGYLCERSQLDSRSCKFKLGREILSQPVEPEQAKKLLETGRSDLLDKFISKAGKPFPAYLVMDDSGKVTFEFPPREDAA